MVSNGCRIAIICNFITIALPLISVQLQVFGYQWQSVSKLTKIITKTQEVMQTNLNNGEVELHQGGRAGHDSSEIRACQLLVTYFVFLVLRKLEQN